ncbi:DUF4365 domain-containing protein [Chitinophaga sedimenti]|uniref:DUF4365 domain-containing protein n=1 Tax=Chitinophaga sedimenti TaxID=2033606 RepID=UPI00355735A2
MALSDRPRVDTFANNSAESVRALTALFYEPNGYISRADIPDKGCDYFIEVVHDGDAKMWRFPLQLKSVQSPKYVDGGVSSPTISNCPDWDI